MQLGLNEVQTELRQVFEEALRQKYGADLGALLGAVLHFMPHQQLEAQALQKDLDLGAAAILNAVVANRIEGSTMAAIRSQLIGAALLGDRVAVERWATEGLNRCPQAGSQWAATASQWRVAQRDPERFILYSRQLKHLTNQL